MEAQSAGAAPGGAGVTKLLSADVSYTKLLWLTATRTPHTPPHHTQPPPVPLRRTLSDSWVRLTLTHTPRHVASRCSLSMDTDDHFAHAL